MGTPRRRAHEPPPTGHPRWARTSRPSAHRDGRHRELGPRHPGSPSPPHAVLHGAGLRWVSPGRKRQPRPAAPPARRPPALDRGCPCRCRAPASSDPGPLAPAAFPLDPGPGQGETAGVPSRGQGVQARPVKGVAEGPDDAVKLVKGGVVHRLGPHPMGDTQWATPNGRHPVDGTRWTGCGSSTRWAPSDPVHRWRPPMTDGGRGDGVAPVAGRAAGWIAVKPRVPPTRGDRRQTPSGDRLATLSLPMDEGDSPSGGLHCGAQCHRMEPTLRAGPSGGEWAP